MQVSADARIHTRERKRRRTTLWRGFCLGNAGVRPPNRPGPAVRANGGCVHFGVDAVQGSESRAGLSLLNPAEEKSIRTEVLGSSSESWEAAARVAVETAAAPRAELRVAEGSCVIRRRLAGHASGEERSFRSRVVSTLRRLASSWWRARR